MKQAARRIRFSVVCAAVTAVACGCSGPKPPDPDLGTRPAAKAAERSTALTTENFEKIKVRASPAEVDLLLGSGRDAPSPPAFYRQAAAAEIEQEFGVKRWREWWSSSTGVTITLGFDSGDKALVKQLDDGNRVRFVGWKNGREIVRTSE